MNFRSLINRALVRRVPNALILAMLVLLGMWGHRHHWRMPRFSELLPIGVAQRVPAAEPGRNPREPSAALGENGELSDSQNPGDLPSGLPQSHSDYPEIHFRSQESVRNSGIRIESAEAKDLDEFVVANGVVEYDETRYAQLASRTSGIAWRVDKNVGDPVHKGEILAILDSSDVGKAKAELLEAAVTFYLKSETFQRLALVEKGVVTERSIRDADAAKKLSHVRLLNAQQTLINLGLPLPRDWDSDYSVEEGANKIQFLGIPEAVVAGFDPGLITANLIPLWAPFDGVVINREIVTGEIIQTGHPQFIIADVSRMWLKLNVRKADAARLAIGQEIWFSADGVPGEVKSRISWIATEVDVKTRTVQVCGEVENPRQETATGALDGQRLLRAHTFGTARIRVRDERRSIVVPTSAIQSDSGRYVIFIPRPDGCSFEPRLVVPGVIRDDNTEIVRGIRDGERVVTSGSYVLKAEMGREQAAKPVSPSR